jgi:hypothetical protein
VVVAIPDILSRNGMTLTIQSMDKMKVVKTVLEQIKLEMGVAPLIGHLAKPNQQLWIELVKGNLE